MKRVQRMGKSSHARKGLANANGKWTYEPQPHCVARANLQYDPMLY